VTDASFCSQGRHQEICLGNTLFINEAAQAIRVACSKVLVCGKLQTNCAAQLNTTCAVLGGDQPAKAFRHTDC